MTTSLWAWGLAAGRDQLADGLGQTMPALFSAFYALLTRPLALIRVDFLKLYDKDIERKKSPPSASLASPSHQSRRMRDSSNIAAVVPLPSIS